MSSPTLPISAAPFFTAPDTPYVTQEPSSRVVTPASQSRPTRRDSQARRPSLSRERSSAEISRPSLTVSRPRPLIPTSPSTPSLPRTPTTPRSSRQAAHSPTRNGSPTPRVTTRSPPLRRDRNGSTSSTSHVPLSGRQTPTSRQHQLTFVGRDSTGSPSPTPGAIPSSFHQRNVSVTSLTPQSPYREVIRQASSILVRELARPPPHLKSSPWEDVEIRLRALTRLERVWGKSGAGSSATAVGSSSGLGGGEEREQRLFSEAVRDGYVLCMFINKLRPDTVLRPNSREDGFRSTSNITKFLAGALHYGLSRDDLFLRDDLLTSTPESLGRVAKTVVALWKLAQPTTRLAPRGIYSAGAENTMSTPNLPSGQRRRMSQPSVLPALPSSSTGARAITPQKDNYPSDPFSSEETFLEDRNVGTPSSYKAPLGSPSLPPRSPLRPNYSRTSVASSQTDTTSMFENGLSTRFGTDAQDSQSATYQTPLTDLPTTSRRQSFNRELAAAKLAASMYQQPSVETIMTRPRKDRRSSEIAIDLSNVEEVDEGTRRAHSSQLAPPTLSMLIREGLGGSDPVASQQTGRMNNDSQAPSSREMQDAHTDPPISQLSRPPEIDLSTSPPKSKSSLPYRRPTHGHRHSVDTMAPSRLVPRTPSAGRERSSPSPNRDSNSPSPSGDKPVLVRRNTPKLSPRPSLVPRANSDDQPSGSDLPRLDASAPVIVPRVPFPRSVSGDPGGVPSRLGNLPSPSDLLMGDPKSPMPRGRFLSELESPRARKARPNSMDNNGGRHGRTRIESMGHLGAAGADALSRESSARAIRLPLIVKEEGKPPMHYQIGNGIGRGQFGAVYRALNLNTGQMVAVKRINLQGLSEDEIANLMKEVDVLKSLSHPSIVKYEGMTRDSDTLSIVLEYVENGSLGQTLKAFGKLNERLVASYVLKILEGLHYLHKSHVVHCDLKAANILTTKNGNVKLSDFGVSLNLQAKALEEIKKDKNDVAGTPHWMAPEVIELKGPSPASDIWSLGCTAIELFTGHPPYHEIQNGMSVMFRIVEDEMPPIPEDCSDPMKEFLKECFRKDPAERPSAEMLFEHPWLKTTWGAHKELRPQDSIPFLRRVSVELSRKESNTTPLSLDTRKMEGSEPTSQFGELSESGPRSPSLLATSPESAELPPRQHSFIKTTFGKAVICRVCHQPVKRSAVLCAECGLIAHSRCAADAPASCDIRAQLLLYAQYAQAGTAQEVSTPTAEPSTPISIPISPSKRNRRMSDAAYSASPPRFAEKFIGGWRRSGRSPELGPTDITPVPSRDSPNTPNSRTRTFSNSPRPGFQGEALRSRSRLSISSAGNTDSMRSALTGGASLINSTRPATANYVVRSTEEDITQRRPRPARLSGGTLATSHVSDSGDEQRRKIKRPPRETQSPRNSGQCIVQ